MAKFNMHDYEKEMRKQKKEAEHQKEVEAKLQSEDDDAKENWREWQEQQRFLASEFGI